MKKISLIIIMLSIIIGGCASKSYVKFVDNSIENYITVKKVNKRILENGFTQVQIMGENETSKYMLFKYRVTWQDKDGFEVKSISSNWTEFSAHKNATFNINIIAPNKKAIDYQIYINR